MENTTIDENLSSLPTVDYITKNLEDENFTTEQLEKITTVFNDLKNIELEQTQNKHEEDLQKVYNSWGFKKKANTTLAVRAFKWLGLDNQDVLNMFNTIAPSKIMDKFVNLGKLLSEDQGNTLTNKAYASLTPELAKKERANLMLDENFVNALTNKKHIGHEAAMEKLNQLNEIISK